VKRREFITLLGGAAVAWPLAASAQPLQRAARPVRIGVLASYFHPPLQRMLQKLKELGYVESETIRFEYRFAEGHDDRYPAMAVELVGLPVDLIVTSGTPAALDRELIWLINDCARLLRAVSGELRDVTSG
jgi:ABC-type uncharacterized transport system substrate-binding protein